MTTPAGIEIRNGENRDEKGQEEIAASQKESHCSITVRDPCTRACTK